MRLFATRTAWASPFASILAASLLCCGGASGNGTLPSDGGTGGVSVSTGAGGDAGTNGSGAATSDGGSGGRGTPPRPGKPRLGAHGLAYYRHHENRLPTISTPAMATQATGSVLVASVGRGDFTAFKPPTDNKGNSPFQQLGVAHTYAYWRNSGTALYAL